MIQSFVLNKDMTKIRQSELVLLKEEEKFAKYSHDPEGRTVPQIQVRFLMRKYRVVNGNIVPGDVEKGSRGAEQG